MPFDSDDFVQIVATNGNYRFGYIKNVTEDGLHLEVCMHEEGESKLAFEEAQNRWDGIAPTDWETALTPIEKRLVSMLAVAWTNKEIASEMGLAHSTIRAHTRTLRLKLGLHDRDQLVTFAQGLEKALEGKDVGASRSDRT